MSAISAMFVHTATVETFTGAGPRGDTYAAPVDIKGFLDDGVVLVQSSVGEQLVQKSIFYAALEDADVFVNESKVTVNGLDSQVSETHRRDSGPLGLPDHVEVHLS